MAIQSSHFPYWPVPEEGIPTEAPTFNTFMPVGVNSQGFYPSGVVLDDGRMLVVWVEKSGGVQASSWAVYQKYIQASEICDGNISPDGARLLARNDNGPVGLWDHISAVCGTMPNGRLFLCMAARFDLIADSVEPPPKNNSNTNLWVSDNEGATWTWLSEVIAATPVPPGNESHRTTAVGGEMVVHPVSGRWLFITPHYHVQGNKVSVPQTIVCASTDQGVTWKRVSQEYHFAYGSASGRTFGMSTNGLVFWNQANNGTRYVNKLYWSNNGHYWDYQTVRQQRQSLLAWADQETMWSAGGAGDDWAEMDQPLPAYPYPADFPGDFLWNHRASPPLFQWGTGTRVHVFNSTEVACWGVPSEGGCPAPTLLHIPYKKWGLPGPESWDEFQWTQNQLRLERWAMENAPDWDQLHLPYDMAFSPSHAEMNYLRLERYAQTQECNCHPLHIPYKKWAYGENPPGWQEDINYLTIERWIKGLTQCSGGGRLKNYYPPVRPPTAPGTCTYPSLSTFPSLTTYPCGGN